MNRIIRKQPDPQQGEPVLFSCRKPAQSNLANCPSGDLFAWTGRSRMLDAESYPHGSVEVHDICSEFRRVSLLSYKLYSDVMITSLNSGPPPCHRRGLRASQGWLNGHAGSSPYLAALATVWCTG